MEVNTLTWAITIIVIVALFTFDFYSHVRKPHPPSMGEAGLWMAFYVALSVAFGVFLWLTWNDGADPHKHGMEYFSGYVTELALSVDNLFVFALIMGSFKVPVKYQQKVLFVGIALSLVLRGIFIAMGAAIIEAWSDVFYLFGLFLLWIALKTVLDEVRDKPETDPDDMAVIRFIRRVIPVSKGYDSDRLTVRQAGKLAVTPLFVCLIAIGVTDLIFALDSIPAIFGITQEPYIVFTATAFSLMGLRQLYFLLGGLMERLVYLPYGLGVILAFIGVKMMFHALHENNLPFINGGEGVHGAPEISTPVSLLVIVGVLVLTVVASLIRSRNQVPERPERHVLEEPGAQEPDAR